LEPSQLEPPDPRIGSWCPGRLRPPWITSRPNGYMTVRLPTPWVPRRARLRAVRHHSAPWVHPEVGYFGRKMMWQGAKSGDACSFAMWALLGVAPLDGHVGLGGVAPLDGHVGSEGVAHSLARCARQGLQALSFRTMAIRRLADRRWAGRPVLAGGRGCAAAPGRSGPHIHETPGQLLGRSATHRVGSQGREARGWVA
jgi:hypothetical protein